MKFPIRINKYLAEKNYATRKGADELIEKSLVFINGNIAKLGDKVYENDKVKVLDNNLNKNYKYFIYNKPIGISTNKDNKKDKDILSVTKFPVKVFPIGRLDKDSHGLIILTNDGRITDKLLSPKYYHEKEYVVRTEKNFSDVFLKMMSSGVRIGGYKTLPCKIWRKGDSKNTFHIILTEGKKRQIRRMCEALHHKVIDLQRIRIMDINLGSTKIGTYKEITGKELQNFLNILNK